jgi:hypothetical protein
LRTHRIANRVLDAKGRMHCWRADRQSPCRNQAGCPT